MTDQEALEEIRQNVAAIRQVILGINGTEDRGLFGTVKELAECLILKADKKSLHELENCVNSVKKEQANQKLRLGMVVAFLMGSGMLGGTVAGLIVNVL